MFASIEERLKAALAPLASELGAVPSGEGVSLGWVAVFALVIGMAAGTLTAANAAITCHGCYLPNWGDCATYRCDDNDESCPTYPPVAKYRTESRTPDGWGTYCYDYPYICVPPGNCNANCGSCQ